MVRAGTCDCLDGSNACLGCFLLLGGRSRIEAEHEVTRNREKCPVAFNGCIFMAKDVVFCCELLLCFLHDR